MELSYEEISNLINEILLAKKIISIDGDKSVLVQPTGMQKIQANFIENTCIQDYLKQGFFSEEDVPQDIINTFFSVDDEEQLQTLLKKVDNYKAVLSKRIPGTELYKKEESRLAEVEQKIITLRLKKETAKQFSAEYQAREDKSFYLLTECVQTLSGEKRWKNVDQLLNNNSDYVYRYIVNFFNFYHGPDVKMLRYIARSNQWRALFLSSRRLGTILFDRPAVDFSIPQIHLTSWSFYYDNIYELPLHERPEDEVIENDQKLDLFLDNYMKKLKAEASQITNNKSSKKSDKQDEQIVTVNDPRYIALHKKNQYSDPKERKVASRK